MKIYQFKNGQISSESIKNKSFSELEVFGVSKVEFDKLVKAKAIILPKVVKAKKKLAEKDK